MAKKPSDPGAPEAPATKKTTPRKASVKKTAPAKKADAKTEQTSVAPSASVEAPKTKIRTVKSAPKSDAKPKTAKGDRPGSTGAVSAPAPAKVAESATPAPVVRTQPATDNPPQVKVKRESFRPNRSQDQQHDRHDAQNDGGFAQPETVGGLSDSPFNKRKRRRRNKKGNGGPDDRQPIQDSFAARNLDGKKVASRAWKIFLAEVSEEGLALMDDQTSREAARRAFRCAEAFMMEETRRKQTPKVNAPQQDRNVLQEEQFSDDDSAE